MAILVTGGAGYIGTHTCVELLESGKDIVVVDNCVNSKPEALNRVRQLTGRDFPFYELDILDTGALGRVFKDNQIDAVIHFAGLKAVGESVQKPLAYYKNNITGTLSLLEAMAAANCRRMVFSSSATVYGANPDVPFKETYPTMAATNPYGATKLMIETILRDLYTADNGWSIALLRYFNPIGAHTSGVLGEDPNGIPNNLLPIIARVVTGKMEILNVTGDDYDTPDGTGVRDYLHVCDLADGHVKAIDYVMGKTGVEAINLGTGKGYSVYEVIKAFEAASGVKVPYKVAPRRPGDIATSYADATKAKELLRWGATRGIDEMCRDLWNFLQKNPNGL
ncbi:MAG: UDP-glucose 4-epimerase GalE [Oscillospiraceae bacterium]|jgi:UDP-glucose 4-epimerase|nr:UDP-glucose 4-epimerase GalE [Oscillospiraceae bacterium]